jgi:hypothetical protein
MTSSISIIIGLGLIIFLIYSFMKAKRGKNSNVTSINRKRSILGSKQACSYCKRKVDKLSFYADRQGKVVGLCDVCKVQAERQALMRL